MNIFRIHSDFFKLILNFFKLIITILKLVLIFFFELIFNFFELIPISNNSDFFFAIFQINSELKKNSDYPVVI